MPVSSPDQRYFKESGSRPNWRFAVRFPRAYAWHMAVLHLPWRFAKLFRGSLGGYPGD